MAIPGALHQRPSLVISGYQWFSPAPSGCPQPNEARECLRNPQGHMRASEGKAGSTEQETAVSRWSQSMAVSCRSQSMAISNHLQQSLAVLSQCGKECHRNPTGNMRVSNGYAVCSGQEMAVSRRSPSTVISGIHQLSRAVNIPTRPGG
jgi:hypothetical protein